MKLREWRESKGVKQRSVAEVVDMTRQTYAKREANPLTFTLQEAQAICTFLGLDLSDVDDFFVATDVKDSRQ